MPTDEKPARQKRRHTGQTAAGKITVYLLPRLKQDFMDLYREERERAFSNGERPVWRTQSELIEAFILWFKKCLRLSGGRLDKRGVPDWEAMILGYMQEHRIQTIAMDELQEHVRFDRMIESVAEYLKAPEHPPDAPDCDDPVPKAAGARTP
jgi:hypothetical protein